MVEGWRKEEEDEGRWGAIDVGLLSLELAPGGADGEGPAGMGVRRRMVEGWRKEEEEEEGRRGAVVLCIFGVGETGGNKMGRKKGHNRLCQAAQSIMLGKFEFPLQKVSALVVLLRWPLCWVKVIQATSWWPSADERPSPIIILRLSPCSSSPRFVRRDIVYSDDLRNKNIDVIDLDSEDSLDANLIAQIQSQVEMRTQLGAMTILCLVAFGLNMLSTVRCTSSNIRDFVSQKERRRHELMSYLIHTEQCRDIIRMGPVTFINLCERVRATGLVKDAFRSTVEEQVAKFLHIVGHNDCLGAIDGTHIRVKVPRWDVARFRGRKDCPTQNVFAACDFDMKFTYVLGGWEDTASDSRILKDVLSRQDSLIIPQGKYYLGDAGFMLKGQIITPYRGVRYHLKEYFRRGPQNPRELFNHRHSLLRNVIERTFGVLKKRFPIIASGTEPHYSLDTMTNIILACCIVHNFLRGIDNDDSLLAEVDRELMEEDVDTMSTQVREEDYREGSNLRDSIANEIWRDYQNN
ncbi:hypothetical protein Fmac_007718 [Flemingia macrophylla]|uniref:Nuclease HARBI1 n=1 Tax=Flemingia macrophylla TaxID=520843 RepID=A0ABD1MVC9_9FABA